MRLVFVAGVTAVEVSEEGGRILDALEEAHGFNPMETGPSQRTYQFTAFPSHAEAIAWLEELAHKENPDADKHVFFGEPH